MASNRKTGKGSKTPTSAGVARQEIKSADKTKGVTIKDEEEREPLAYKVLSEKDTQTLTELETIDEVQEKMAEVMKITSTETDQKQGAQLEYYASAIWWGREQGFTVQQLSAFFTVIHTALENLQDKQLSLVDSLKELKKMLVGVGAESSETAGGLGCLDVQQAKLILDFCNTTIFQHYKLYQFVFTHTPAEEIIGTDLLIEVAKPADMPWPPPLDEAVPEELFNEYIKTPPPTPAPQEAEEETGEDEEGGQEHLQSEADILAQLSPDEIKAIMDSVFTEMLGDVQTEVAAKLREKENAFINRINKIHKVA